MNRSETLKNYLKHLEAADYDSLMGLFAEGAVVISPLYGEVKAEKFYRDLFEDTAESRLTLLNIFQGEQENVAAVHFQFDWVLADGSRAPFEVVDVCKFAADGKIEELKIIYDSAKTREAFEGLGR